MRVKSFEKNAYELLIEYAFRKCDYFGLYRNFNQCFDIHDKIIDVITENVRYSKQNIVKNYSGEFLNQIYEDYKNDLRIYKAIEKVEIADNIKMRKKAIEGYLKEYIRKESQGKFFGIEHKKFCEQYLENPERIELETRKETIFLPVNWIYYDFMANQFLNTYKSNIKSETNIYLGDTKSILHSTRYLFELTDETKTILLNGINNIYSWCFPKMLENLCFIKDNNYWLTSTGHEKICNIYCESESEYKYLKSIGVNFYEEHFILEQEPYIES